MTGRYSVSLLEQKHTFKQEVRVGLYHPPKNHQYKTAKQETAEDGMAGLQSKFQNLNKKVNQG